MNDLSSLIGKKVKRIQLLSHGYVVDFEGDITWGFNIAMNAHSFINGAGAQVTEEGPITIARGDAKWISKQQQRADDFFKLARRHRGRINIKDARKELIGHGAFADDQEFKMYGYGVLAKLAEEGVLKRVGRGEYRLAGVR